MDISDKSAPFISYLMSLEEEDFFFIASNVLGKIPAPFHKPALAQRIAAFLMNDDNRTRILASLTDKEKSYITFVLLMKTVTEQQFLEFFARDTFYLASSRLENLKDRLIFIKDKKNLIVNPLLEDDMRTKVFIPFTLLESIPAEDLPQKPVVDTNIIRAMLNLLANGSVPVREANAHHFNKSGKLQLAFPQFDKEGINRVFEAVKKLALGTGAIKAEQSKFVFDIQKSSLLVISTPMDIALASIDYTLGFGTSDITKKALQILASVPARSDKFMMILKTLGLGSVSQASLVTDCLLDFGILVMKNSILYINPFLAHCADIPRSVLMTDSDLVVSYFGTPGKDDILHLFADILQCDNLISYTITKSSFTRALDLGLTIDDIIDYLGFPNARQTLEKWEESHCRVRLYDGIVVKCTQEIGQIIQKHPDLQNHIIERLDPQLFLFRRSTYNIWQPILSYALDIESLSLPTEEQSSDVSFGHMPEHFSIDEIEKIEKDNVQELPSWDEISCQLYEDAKDKGIALSDIKDLIDSRLIVSKSQIDRTYKYAALPSVSGFDYNGKITMLRSAIKDGKTLLKLELTDEDIIVKPLELTKTDLRNSLLKVRVLPEDTERSISVSSIFKMTLLRRSMI